MRKKRTDKRVTLLKAIVWCRKYPDKKTYLLIANKNSKPKSHSESDYSILVKRTCDGGVDPIKGFPPFLANRMRVSISHQVLQYGE
jgi:hypothetical protein